MPADINQVSPLDGTMYYVGDSTRVEYHPVILTRAVPTPVQRALQTTAGTLAPGVTTLTASTATTSKLYDQQLIVLPNLQVIQIDASAQAVDPASGARFFPVGATSLKIYPPLTTITIPASSPYEEFQPLWSCDTAKFTADGTIVDFKNFRAGPFKTKVKSMMDTTFEVDGFTTRIDQMLQLARSAAVVTDAYLKVRYIPPDGFGCEFIGQVASIDLSTKDGDPYRAPFKFAPGVPKMINFTPS
jgi:hypothetical protein